ncbi:MAG: 16S rRNA (cytosine(1402)-N(4))-methyltransferase RsmH [Gammaproteobacteria bacterium]|nr:16S rRNA (cytosine(1402)-N(4))-methyltransferase RsmH [Gammaproteobacteria bacterium]
MTTPNEHQPVMLEEALAGLAIKADGIYVDGTFGRGGHSGAILDRLQQGKLLAMDKDPRALATAQEKFSEDDRFLIRQDSFANMAQVVEQQGWLGQVDGILLDLGVSSPQLDDPERGFSFKQNGPLDMRMDPTRGMSAAEWISKAKEQDIATVLKEYGEERFAKRIARAICVARAEAPIDTTSKLAAIVAAANPKWEKGKDPATRSFQAIRIFINDELEDLKVFLQHALQILKPGGRLVVISFHSLEDRLIKRFIREQSRGDQLPPDLPVTHVQLNQKMKAIGKAIRPSAQEQEQNVRSRSSILRVAEKLA